MSTGKSQPRDCDKIHADAALRTVPNASDDNGQCECGDVGKNKTLDQFVKEFSEDGKKHTILDLRYVESRHLPGDRVPKTAKLE